MSGAQRGLIGGLLTAVLVAVLTLVMAPQNSGSHRTPYFFGTLRTDPDKAREEHDRGIGVAHVTIRWEQFEPSPGEYDTDYIGEIEDDLRTLHQAGARIELGVGLNHPPPWLYERYPEAAFTNEHGDRYEDTSNIVFNQRIRDEVRRYIQALEEKVGLGKFWAIRVGVNDKGEFALPPPVPDDGRPGNDYWAYDATAQETSHPDRARTLPPNPYPGWRPGERQYKGEPFTREQAARWYQWYLGTLPDAVNWQVDTYRSIGFQGLLKVLVPGAGYYPGDYAAALRQYFAGPYVNGLIGRAVAYFWTIEQIRLRKGVQIVATSLVNGSGTPPDNSCRATDTATDLDTPPDTAVRRWSSVRWVTSIARRAGFTVSGESAGPHVRPYYPGVMDDAARQVRSCRLKGLMWAFDDNLYDGTPGSSLHDYARTIDRLN
ncbi:beta-galactosidase [Streptomyces sp. NPDC005931]|uniref:beta-galactosidase n=1 Tax=Streptomyces sp. NPDC005931 TaxID=3364737 RepID=UPI0036BA0347